jgi:hypothetical protein
LILLFFELPQKSFYDYFSGNSEMVEIQQITVKAHVPYHLLRSTVWLPCINIHTPHISTLVNSKTFQVLDLPNFCSLVCVCLNLGGNLEPCVEVFTRSVGMCSCM